MADNRFSGQQTLDSKYQAKEKRRKYDIWQSSKTTNTKQKYGYLQVKH